jgi:hypothetical protein
MHMADAWVRLAEYQEARDAAEGSDSNMSPNEIN